MVKPDFYEEAASCFNDTNVKITTDGRPYLGTPLGSDSYTSEFVAGKVNQLKEELRTLSVIATSQPHAAFTAFTHGMMSKWTHISRTIPDISSHLQSLEAVIQSEFIPSITGRSPPNNVV